MDDLVRRLSEREQPVEVTIRPERTLEKLKQCIDRGYVHIKFPETRGGTELGVRLDKEQSNLQNANFSEGSGSVKLVGSLKLNYTSVRCTADINLNTFSGKGRLEVVA